MPATQEFKLTFEEFPLISDLGFEALPVLEFEAVIEYGPTVDDGWCVASLWTDGEKKTRRTLSDSLAYLGHHGSLEGFEWIETETKRIEIERGSSLWQMIVDRIESKGHWFDQVNDQVVERFEEARACAADDYADYRRAIRDEVA